MLPEDSRSEATRARVKYHEVWAIQKDETIQYHEQDTDSTEST